MKSKITIFESNIEDGIMSRNKKFYPSTLTQDQIDEKFLQTRLKLGDKYNFNGKKIFQAAQKTETNNIKYKDGQYIVISDKNLKKDDYWYEELPADILIITKEYPNIVVGNQMADCPILIAEDRKLGVTALAHCGVSYIDRELPKQVIEALEYEYNSNLSDIYVYIGSCAKKETYIYETYPRWAINKKVWESYIIEDNNKYHIDITGAIINQLKNKGITNIRVSPNDTISDKKIYSHYAAVNNIPKAIGQNFVGFYYNNHS